MKGRSGVTRTWPDQLPALYLFKGVCQPADVACQSKNDERRLVWQPESVGQRGKPEVDIWQLSSAIRHLGGDLHKDAPRSEVLQQ